MGEKYVSNKKLLLSQCKYYDSIDEFSEKHILKNSLLTTV